MAEACQQLLDDDNSDGIDWLSCSPDSQYDFDRSQLSFTNYTITIHQDYTRILKWNFLLIKFWVERINCSLYLFFPRHKEPNRKVNVVTI